MNKGIILTLLILLLGSYLSYQRSHIIHYSYQSARLEKEGRELRNKIKTLKMEIRELVPPEVLYAYWKRNHSDLEFVNAKKKRDQTLALLRHHD